VSDEQQYAKIPLAAVRALVEEQSADFEVFLPGTNEQGPVLYRTAGIGLSQPDFDRLGAHGVTSLYVLPDDYHRCETTLEVKLNDIIANPRVTPEDKAQVVQSVGTCVARDLIQSSVNAEHVGRASTVLDCMINCVLSDPVIAASLLEMAGHERSTASHMFVVANLAVMLGAEVFGSDIETLKDLGFAGMLHDVGKLSIGPEVLNKSTPLTPAELDLVHQHPIESVRLIGDNQGVSCAVRQMILQHHERVDGRGYPLGLNGDELLAGSKLLSIVDSFHAMIGHRSYRRPLTPSDAISVLATQAGKQFDANLFVYWQGLFERSWSEDATRRLREHLASPHELSSRHEHRPTPIAQRELLQRPPRFACHGKTVVQCVYAGRLTDATAAPEEFAALAHDVSRGGLCIYTAHPMYRGEIVHVRVKINDRHFWVRSSVAWCRRQDACAFRIGLRFATRIGDSQVDDPCDVETMTDLRHVRNVACRARLTGHSVQPPGSSSQNQTPAKDKHDSALNALDAIATTKRDDSQAVGTAITLAMSEDHTVRLKAIEVLAGIGTTPARETVVSMLHDVNPAVRAQAASVVGMLKIYAAIGPLRNLLHDSTKAVALRAAGALGRLGDKSGMRLVSGILNDAGPENRLAAQVFGDITGHRFSANREGVAAARRYLAAKKAVLLA